MSTLVITLNNSPARWGGLPLPADQSIAFGLRSIKVTTNCSNSSSATALSSIESPNMRAATSSLIARYTRVALDQPTDPTTAEVLRNVDPQSTRGSRGIPIVRPAEPAERRTSLDEFLVGSKRSLITAEAGG